MIETGDHRKLVGGMWDVIGRQQFEYLVRDGLLPQDRLLDVGCGCLRGGVHFVDYLEAGHYFGIDISTDLLDVGYEVELAELGLQHKLPRSNLHTSEDFDAAPFETEFDAALALSLFTHLPLNHIRLCLARLAGTMRPGARFFATVFVAPDGHGYIEPLPHIPGGVKTYPHRDPYHYTRADLDFCCRELPFQLERLEEWNHPRDQWMAVFRRVD